jgi:hypothetical protein
MTTTTIHVDTRQYRRKHGHEPRGRFLWTFRIGRKERLWVADNGETYPLYATSRGEYAECLAKAIRHAESAGAKDVAVCSTTYGQD